MEIGISLFITILAVSTAYIIKGFSGFGPALLLIPVLTLLYDPATGIVASALFDAIAGPIMFLSVYKRIDWKFIIPVILVFFVGSYFGVQLMKTFSPEILEKIIGIGLIIFIAILIFQNPDHTPANVDKIKKGYFHLLITLVAGIGGGLIGMSGPLLVIYMKLNYRKEYFRDQLITLFMFGAIWRFGLYITNGIQSGISASLTAVLILVMLGGLWIGHHMHLRVNEQKFNRAVALILLIPAVNLIVF